MKNPAKVNSCPAATRPADAAGFTLLEVLLSIALTAMVLIAMNTFIFSMSELWGSRNEPRLLELHVRSVTRFLDQQLRNAAMPPEAQPNEPAIVPMEVRPLNGSSENMLTFELPDGCRLFHWPGAPLPDVVCSLQVRPGEGLFLLWHSKLEKHFSEDPPRETLISPFVTSMTYDYYDASGKTWSNVTIFRTDNSNNPVAPQRIRLQFAYNKIKRESVITLGTPREGLPDY